MRKFIMLLLTTLMISVPMLSQAIWQISNPIHHANMNRYVNPEFGKTDHPGIYNDQSKYIITLQKGLLKHNVERFAENCHWNVVWNAPENYYVLLHTKIAGPSLAKAMNRLLGHYPIHARYDYRTCTMTVLPNTHRKYYK